MRLTWWAAGDQAQPTADQRVGSAGSQQASTDSGRRRHEQRTGALARVLLCHHANRLGYRRPALTATLAAAVRTRSGNGFIPPFAHEVIKAMTAGW